MSDTEQRFLARWTVIITTVGVIASTFVALGIWYGNLERQSDADGSDSPQVTEQEVTGSGNVTIGNVGGDVVQND